MQDDPRYADVVDEVAGLRPRAGPRRPGPPASPRSGSTPGSASARPWQHNLTLLRHLGELVEAADAGACAGVVVGTSRKRFLGLLAAAPTPGQEPGEPPTPAPLEDRLAGSLATAAAALVAGVGMVRVHDVAATVQLARLYGPAA